VQKFNKKGDEGYTDLLFGRRELKCHPRIDVYGEIDEAVSVLGLARALVKDEWSKEIILGLQNDLFLVSTELATFPEAYHKLKNTVTQEMIQRLEDLINQLETKVELPNKFIIPGDSMISAILDIGRAMIRRIERRVVRLREEKVISNSAILSYLNRLADLLFTLARYQESLVQQG
jgi:cob(I)alamin adenosyltransferase